ncbi:PD-(D/E)XK nuclease family protein [Neolewinella lacunae]|uniref:PD-(D/E)XK nuclease family protein n=1 Tax=Neolewinella lacunae TaxID=1517758 RepID=A0A923PNP7_9BACT|nr:PD-(D/E)XK nuclease family protein [Neolewinella lacunae]MBC6996809.1 PD-(D/E)XK nuclease family protein [Neolewinella lacunae]MDN3637037.1 PD-(D/E)XK nuclease family protein [Neolewinella lacunae]
MRILLGLSFADQQLLPAPPAGPEGYAVFSPAALLRYLETFYALGAPAINRTALRTEQYRQLLTLHLGLAAAPPFYEAAFRADEFATAAELLSRRDELLDAGYALARSPAAAVPPRLLVLHELEALLLDDTYTLDLLPGPADRLNLLLGALGEDRHPRLWIGLNEPRPLLPPGLRRLLDRLEARGDSVEQLPEPVPTEEDHDLGRWQHCLTTGQRSDTTLQGDGSLVLLRAERETHLAAYVARLLRDQPDWRPGALLTVRNQTLDNALVSEGLPSLGVPSTSLARPSLQVLKLVTAFLWDPLEVDRIMEFVSLVTKPLHWRLAQRIATYLADTPGLFGPRWFAMIEGFFTEMREERQWTPARLKDVRDQYESWFRRRRYPRSGRVPKFDLRQLFVELRQWAMDERNELRKEDVRKNRVVQDYAGLLVLAAQAQRATELLDAQPEADLGFLEIERLIRTVYEPAPTRFQPREQGSLTTVFAPASVQKTPSGAAAEEILWWDFVEHEPDYFFSRYYPDELAWLAAHDAEPNGPRHQNELARWQQARPILHARRRLVLCLPARVDGEPVEPHPLLGDLEAAFPPGALARITVDVDAAEAASTLLGSATPQFAPVPLEPLDRPRAQLHIERLRSSPEREFETPTALEDLLYYPHKWVFRHYLKLKGTPILSVANENRLRGNLSHLFIERLLTAIGPDPAKMNRTFVREWIDEHWRGLLEREGAVLLEYGQEPERVQFVRTMHYAAWSLVHYIQENGWTIRSSEQTLEGDLEAMGQSVRGRADLLLERHKNGRPELCVVDLKWRGKTVFRNLLRNAKDVQLCLYAEFITQNKGRGEDGQPLFPAAATVHTAYYIIRDAVMLSRNELAFANIETVAGQDEARVVQQETLRKIRTTYNWRWEQFREGTVEVRCAATLGALQDAYLDLDHGALLEMEEEDARFDDYGSLIGLVV